MKYLVPFLTVLTLSSSAFAGVPGDVAEEEKPNPPDKILPLGASLVPGLLLHGSGHFALGQRKTAWRLFLAQGVGLGMIVLGGASLAVSGASPRFNGLSIWTLSGGAGLFLFSWMADVFGVLNSESGTGLAVRKTSTILATQGYQFVYNPSLDGAHFSKTSLTGRWGGWSLGATGWFGLDDEQWRFQARAARRFFGPRQDKMAADGSFFDLWLGYTHHRFGSFGVTELFGELGVTGRYDLRRIGPTLKGLFVEGSLGTGSGSALYDGHESEYANILISRIAMGLYLGHQKDGWSEAQIFYDHRHDGFAGGAKLEGQGSGAGGSGGVRLKLGVLANWGLDVGAEFGSAYVVDANIVYRFGGSR